MQSIVSINLLTKASAGYHGAVGRDSHHESRRWHPPPHQYVRETRMSQVDMRSPRQWHTRRGF